MEQDHLLENGEVMLEKVRKHWIVYIQYFIAHIFGCIVCIILAHYVTTLGWLSFIDKDSSAYAGMVLVMLVIIFWTSFFYAWTKSYFDLWYVTDRHIIAINQKQIFEREEAFMELTKIQDVFFEKNSFLATFFGFGKLKVQTAGSDQEFIIENVSNVEEVSHRIMELRDSTHNKVSDRTIDKDQTTG